ncbi:uncharacterized protein CTRU02_209527 [Colletotrichum truncatum]|uniref:Uncharacterized protein n=1 Tax=Colletotrichum truncatum TaxID=5467 RepID=A0ACC3YSQ1_COLTU|nr:uncharacterized protein CTRU02_14452 [Colletotrichum truncatum]KAF6782122.1 hypothetical protein CTRU02_14452 [Colletotrichum truncatum]
MSGRVQKSKSKNPVAYKELSQLVDLFGFIMPVPCSGCAAAGVDCVVSEVNSSRCSRCVADKHSCDIHGPSAASLIRVRQQKIKIDDKLEKAEEEQLALMAKIRRLRRRRKDINREATDLIRSSLRRVEEVENEYRSEVLGLQSASSETMGVLHSLGAIGVVDWSGVGLDDWGPETSSGASIVGVLPERVPGS